MLAGPITGLCGNANGISSDDTIPAGGQTAILSSQPIEFYESYRSV